MAFQTPEEISNEILGTPLNSNPKPEELTAQNEDSPHINEIHLNQEDVHADAQLTDDGRLNITVRGRKESLSRVFEPILADHVTPEEDQPPPLPKRPKPSPSYTFPTSLNIVIHIIGSRGDVQPFIALGQVLHRHGHRVRLATHPVFKTFVEDHGLEFYNIGGDPAQLMAFMVKNPGLLPGVDSLRAGEVGKRRKEMAEIIDGCWRSCIDPGDGMTGQNFMDAIEEGREEDHNGRPPFIADAIIANPPSFAHVHCAEKLRIPLHIMFTMPWSPTRAFPHPLANIQAAEHVNDKILNYFSYTLVETMTWQGLGDLVNSFRAKRLGISEIDPTFAPGMISRLKIPCTYAWSPALIPKPEDWAAHLSVSGFFFLPLASTYTPPDDLAAFLDAGPPPVYIGFGSIVVDNPDELTELILQAVSSTGVRALISKGWGGLGASGLSLPDTVFMLGNCPHDWLFPRVSCVVHHGGAGTMAAGIAAGKPTIIVPFFGDQPFWGDMVARAGAGPLPIPYKKLTAARLASAITEALQPTMTERAIELGTLINQETGTETAASLFYSQLPLERMHCCVSPCRLAVWKIPKTNIRLSAMGATILSREGLIDIDELKIYGSCDYRTDYGASDPLSAGVKVGYRMIGDLITGFGEVSRGMYKTLGPNSSKASSATGDVSDDRDIASEKEGNGHKKLQKKNKAILRTLPSDTPSPSEKSKTMKGLKRLGTMPFKTLADLTTSMAQGLHNAPTLYGDKTVRPREKITGWQSGMKAAGKELGFGVYDGFTGVLTHPVQGYKEEGQLGLYKGIGKGLGGVLVKPLAGVSGFFGFTFSGIYAEVQKKHGRTVDGYIRAVRIAQGIHDCESDVNGEERAEILHLWAEIQAATELRHQG